MIPRGDVAIETLGLRKAYRTVRGRAVGIEGLDLRVPAGGVHALLGLPESGKTTTLRLLTGLARADAGAIKIFGVPVPDGLPDLAGRIGAVVGEPGFQPRLSGRRNLALLASAAGAPRARVDEVLTGVLLADRAKAAYGTYSAEEERRLALAAALLRDPDLLVVDDPSAGLGAVGTREIRQALRRLADQGKTVLVATGVLTEAQQIADTVTVLDGGRVLAQGSVAELLGDAKVSVRVRLDELAKAATALRAAGFAVRDDGDALQVDGVAEPADISRALAKQKLFASELVPQREDLAAVVGRLSPVAPPIPKPLSRAEERAARKAAEQQAADRKKAADQRKADKEAAARQAAIDAKGEAKADKASTAKAAPAKVTDTEVSADDDAASQPSKRVQRRAAFDDKVAAKQAAAGARIAERQEAAGAKAAAKEAEAVAKEAARQAKTDDRAAQKRAAADEKAARKQAAADARAARSAARKDGARALLGRRASETTGGQTEPATEQDKEPDQQEDKKEDQDPAQQGSAQDKPRKRAEEKR
ncbi:ATP-binding cassette domain-containing protein [Promicromonospora sp. CA-289599]|uniref:ATP-binding cassette domain-containing protein n=1 Tax=Promicromonospora sp. CA-289599 TaxID=3240014 RepID=UPI003D8C0716